MVTLADALRCSALGWSVIPMRMATKTPADRKKPAVKWKRFQTRRPDHNQLRKWFDNGHDYGLAVIFGDVSGGLASRDFDDLASYEHWASQHPDLAKMLPTDETRRGRQVFCRFASDDVAAFRRLIGKPDGTGAIKYDDGEFRPGVGCYSVVPPSQHPSGFIYRWLVSPFERSIPFLTIAESGFADRATERQRHTETEETEAIEGRAVENEENDGTNAIDVAILTTLPIRPGQRNDLVFELARSLKAIPGLDDADFNQLQPLVKRWHNQAKPYIGSPAFEETWADFIHGWPRVKFAKGKEPMTDIVAKAISAEPPESVRHYESEPLKQLASLCRELQRATGSEPFFLSVRTVGRYFDVDPGTASRWLNFLRVEQVIDEVEKGSQKTRRASRFRYRSDP